MKIMLSIVYAYYNEAEELEKSILSLNEAVGPIPYEVIVVDNASKRRVPVHLSKQKNIKIIRSVQNNGYSAALNIGGNASKSVFILFSNPDIVYLKNSIRFMVNRLKKDKKIGVIGPQILDEKKQIAQSIGGLPFLPGALLVFSVLNKIFPSNKYSRRYWLSYLNLEKEHKVGQISGACMMMRKEVFRKIRGFDEQFFIYFEESDVCYRIAKNGYSVLYFPAAKIIHLGSRGMRGKTVIQRRFEQSRFLFFKKYHGFFPALAAEIFLRTFTPTHIILFFVFLFSLFLNLYKLDTLMMFFGDFGRDYLAARDLLLTHRVPLLGIPSSSVWLHQGPVSIYLIAISFLIGNFNPIAPAVLYGLLGSISTIFVFVLGKMLFNKWLGLLSALIYTTSPFIMVNTRMPYHTSLIPFFSLIFFIVLAKFLLGSRKLFPLVLFLMGVLIQTELSNIVVIPIFISLMFFYKVKLERSIMRWSIIGLLLGFLPFVLYDFSHYFVQTRSLYQWFQHSPNSFLNKDIVDNMERIWSQIRRIIFPRSNIVVISLLLYSFYLFLKNLKMQTFQKLTFLYTWLLISIAGFLIRSSSSEAYIPLVFPAISLLIGYSFWTLIQQNKIFIGLFLVITLHNAFYTVSSDYFMLNQHKEYLNVPGWNYNLGPGIAEREEVVDFIVKDAKGSKFKLHGGGYLSKFSTGIDNYRYLVWWKKGRIDDRAKFSYTIYEGNKDIAVSEKIVYHNAFIYVTSHK